MSMKIVYLLGALDILNLSMFIITFSPYVRGIGGSHSYMGIVMSSSAVVSLFWNPIVGSIGDHSGRKGILIKCLSISLVGNIIILVFKPLESLAVIYISRLICSFGAPTGSLIRTLVTDIAKTPEEKSTAMSKLGGFSALTFMMGALMGGFMNENKNGSTINMTIICLIGIVSIVTACLLPNPEKKPQEKGKKAQKNNQLKEAFQSLKKIDWDKFWELFTIKLLTDLCSGIMQSNLGVILAQTFMIRGKNMGLILTLISICNIATNFSMIKLKKTLYANDEGFQRLMHGTILLMLSFAGMGTSTNFYIFMIFFVMMGIARPLIDTTLTNVLTNRASEQEKGGILSLFESILSLTGMVSPLFSGVVADKYGEQVPIMLCAIPAMFASIMAARQKSRPIKAD
ncbi:unnamed protein product [Brassicogethes aeneus]|uniref:Major facilitator superfamily (MFS) profile domain-containing protein n=1 Tax=Brassicogethes aeneus TaxID=1431903 RepID=A0A9P0FFJ2_BRAAE|nr:unnamed protein product [Brassicogethes aeneus]